MSPTTIPQRQPGDEPYLTLTAEVYAPVAPVSGYDLYVYDAAGETVAQQSGGIAAHNGVVQVHFELDWGVPAGEYTVGFTVRAGSLSSSYGTPGGLPMPGGPLTFTVTPV